jgi:hypothetical protein
MSTTPRPATMAGAQSLPGVRGGRRGGREPDRLARGQVGVRACGATARARTAAARLRSPRHSPASQSGPPAGTDISARGPMRPVREPDWRAREPRSSRARAAGARERADPVRPRAGSGRARGVLVRSRAKVGRTRGVLARSRATVDAPSGEARRRVRWLCPGFHNPQAHAAGEWRVPE